MLSQTNLQLASQLKQSTLEFLDRYMLAATPINYSVIYLCLAKQNKDLTNAISDKISHDGKLDDFYLSEMFQQYVTEQSSNSDNIILPIEKIITQTIASLNGQVESQQQFMTNLDEVDKSLTKDSSTDSVQNLVQLLTSEISKSRDQHQQLSNELAEAGNKVKQLQVQLEKSQKDAITDSLTGLLNRRGCTRRLQGIDVSHQHASLVIDIDHFKAINDNFGHHIGDKVLQRVAKEILSQINDVDFAVRFGGEEFLVVLVNKSIDAAKDIAENIRQGISKLKLVQKQSAKTLPPITVSIGISTYDTNEDFMDMFNRADDALYHAKNTGRNRCVVIATDSGRATYEAIAS